MPLSATFFTLIFGFFVQFFIFFTKIFAHEGLYGFKWSSLIIEFSVVYNDFCIEIVHDCT